MKKRQEKIYISFPIRTNYHNVSQHNSDYGRDGLHTEEKRAA